MMLSFVAGVAAGVAGTILIVKWIAGSPDPNEQLPEGWERDAWGRLHSLDMKNGRVIYHESLPNWTRR